MEGEVCIDEFHRVYKTVTKSKELVEKALWIVKTFECFRSDKPPPHKQYKPSPQISTRKSLIPKDLSIEANTTRHITTLMNKLSPKNKEHIISQVRSTFREDHANMVVDIIWDFMLRSPEHQDLYTDVLLILTPYVSPFITAICNKWLVSPDTWSFGNNDITTDYDDFCDSVKRKQRAVSAIRGFGYFLKKRLISPDTYKSIISALHGACSYLITQTPSHQFEVVIEQFKAAIPAVAATFDISRWIELAPSLPPSARFKIYDIRDKNL